MKYNVVNTNNRGLNNNSLNNRKSLFDVFFGDRFYNDFFDLEKQDFAWTPKIDILEEKDKYKISLDVPGISKDDIKIEVKDGILAISGERKEEKVSEDATLYRTEKRYGSFARTFNITDVDEEKIEADYKNGVLKLSLPKRKEKQAKQISIKTK